MIAITATRRAALPRWCGWLLLTATLASGETLTPLDPATADDQLRSVPNARSAIIDFVNRSGRAVDIYWIDFNGDRVLSKAALAPGATWSVLTGLQNPWLIVASGSGGTTVRGTGLRLASFEAVTANDARDPSIRDTAIITGARVTPPSGNLGPIPISPPEAPRSNGGASGAAVLTRVDPDYSALGFKMHVEGSVGLRIIVSPEGAPQDITVVRSIGYGLDEKAVEAVRQWRFRPASRDGRPVAIWANIESRFHMPDAVTMWNSEPIQFVREPGLIPPILQDGAMPSLTQNPATETVVLGFMVDATGAAINIHYLSGSRNGGEFLEPFVRQWKFQPALKDGLPVNISASVRFVKGR